jgi:hypothetical protein
MQNDIYKGFTLFNDVTDAQLRNYNRSVIMSNIAEFNIKQEKITKKGASLIIGYFDLIPDEDKKQVYASFEARMKEKNFIIEGVQH